MTCIPYVQHARLLMLLWCVVCAVIMSSVVCARDLPMSIDGHLVGPDGTIIDNANVSLSVMHEPTQRVYRFSATSRYSIVLEANIGDRVHITANVDDVRANRTVVMQGVMHDVDLVLNHTGVDIRYPEPRRSSPELPFHYHGVLTGDQTILDKLLNRVGVLPKTRFVNLRTNTSFPVTPITTDAREYVVTVTARPLDPLAIISGEVMLENLRASEDWRQIDLDTKQQTVVYGDIGVPRTITRSSRTFIVVVILCMCLCIALVFLRIRYVRGRRMFHSRP